MSVDSTRAAQGARLRALLARYHGGRFELAESGGAGGMVFFRDQHDRPFYIGGFQHDHARNLVDALNLTLELLQRRG